MSMETYGWTDPKLGHLVIATSDPIGREMIRLARREAELQEAIDTLEAQLFAAIQEREADKTTLAQAEHREYLWKESVGKTGQRLRSAEARIQVLEREASDARRTIDTLTSERQAHDRHIEELESGNITLQEVLTERFQAIENGIAHVEAARLRALEVGYAVLYPDLVEKLDLAREALRKVVGTVEPARAAPLVLWSGVEPATDDDPEHHYAILADGTYTMDGEAWPIEKEHPAIAELARRLLAERAQ